MSYSGGCIIGVCLHDKQPVYFGGGGAMEGWYTKADVNTYATYKTTTNPQQTWQTFDNAWTPTTEIINNYGYSIEPNVWAVCEELHTWRRRTVAANAMLACGNIRANFSITPKWVYASGLNTFAIATSVQYVRTSWRELHQDSAYLEAFCYLAVDWPAGGGGGVYNMYGVEFWDDQGPATSSQSLWREVAPVLMVELPYNQELTTYKRTDIAPSSEKVMTLDGASRRYITGSGSTTIDATWRWSDDGTIADKLADILAISMDAGAPLVVYTPRGTYFSGSFLDLVVCDTPPEVTMVAPGVYELHIVGTCQP